MTKNNIFGFHIPNGGSRNYYEAISLQRQGLVKGIPDMCIPIPSRAKHSLYIELKRANPKGRITEEQKSVIGLLNSFGHEAVVCYGFEEAKKAIMEYLNLSST